MRVHETRAVVEASFQALHAPVTHDHPPKGMLGTGTDLGLRVSGDLDSAAALLERVRKGMNLAEEHRRAVESAR